MAEAENFFIELDNYPGFYFPGQTVTGRVVRIVTGSEEQIDYVRINFKGMATVSWITSNLCNGGNSVRPHKNEEIYFDDVIQLNQQNDGSLITSIPNGRHSFPFVFNLPTEIPGSFNSSKLNPCCQFNCTSDIKSGTEIKIFYQGVAALCLKGRPKSETIKTLVSFIVQRPIDLNFYPWAAEPNVLQGQKYLYCWCCRSGPISFRLNFKKTGFLIGERIKFLAEFLNNTRQDVEGVEVWITRTVTFQATDYKIYREIWEEQLGPRFSIPRVPARQKIEVPVNLNMIPDHTQINSFGCSFMNSFYELHIRMAIPWERNLKGRITIAIGVVPFVIQLGHPD